MIVKRYIMKPTFLAEMKRIPASSLQIETVTNRDRVVQH